MNEDSDTDIKSGCEKAYTELKTVNVNTDLFQDPATNSFGYKDFLRINPG